MIGRFSQLGSYRELLNITDFIRAGFGGMLALIGFVWDWGRPEPSAAATMLLLGSIAVNGLPIILEAVRGVIRKEVNVDELVSLAILACLFTGEFLSAAVVGFVMVIGALIEEAVSESARKAIRSLIRITPTVATVIQDGNPVTRPIAEVNVGDLLLVKPGERIPVDADIREGITAVDESSITGEPIPLEKSAGDSVYAGTLNQNGVIKIEARRVGEETTFGKVIRLVSEAEAHKPGSVSLIDRYARWFTPFILACAAVTWAVTGVLDRAVAVLIVGCPCALILAAPTAIVATIGRAARSGILIKGGQHIEAAGTADVVLFDKTGTLTEGDPRVESVMTADGVEREYLLRQAACVEQDSTHPLARAVLKAAHYAKISVTAAENLFTEIGRGIKGCVEGCMIEVGNPGMGQGALAIPTPLQNALDGIKEKGATPLVVYKDQKPLGILSVADPVRPLASKTVADLHRLHVQRTGILSGDHEKSVRLVAEAVGVTDRWAELLPADKLNIIRDLQSQGSRVIFVGDGINDAPALAASDVGIAMGAKGTEVALETADIALMNDDIAKLPFLIRLSRRMVTTIKWNIAFGLAFNLVSVLAGGSGFLSPIMGAIVHNVGSVIVVISSATIGFATER